MSKNSNDRSKILKNLKKFVRKKFQKKFFVRKKNYKNFFLKIIKMIPKVIENRTNFYNFLKNFGEQFSRKNFS